MSIRRFVAAAVQVCAGSDKAANLEKAESFVVEAARNGARLIVLPEVCLWRGPRAEERSIAEPIPGPSTRRLGDLARQLGIHLLAGSLMEENGAKPASAWVKPGRRAAVRTLNPPPF